ncbi:C-GCAxxG-C-C family protein [Sunxiuqinia sp. A32]|uniref:C-GCAxxG-C-C family protein n=1 Tax=Sunxiuqinia sp. A32 TaxID=3461496 RepID=UPI004046175B
MKKSSAALAKFSEFNCSQSVFSTFASEMGLNEAASLKIASGFGGGMGCAETCGAVTGAYMVIGMKHGHAESDAEAKAYTKSQILRFNELFKAKNGSLVCKELLGVDISNPQESEFARENDLFNKVCNKLIESSCDILEEEF